jgi:hypothetical protein
MRVIIRPFISLRVWRYVDAYVSQVHQNYIVRLRWYIVVGSCLSISFCHPVGSACSETLFCLTHRRPQALHNVFGPMGP